MVRRSRWMIVLGALLAVGALMSTTGPALAVTVEKGCTTSRTSSTPGSCGAWQVKDSDPGKHDVTCTYNTSSHLLSKLTIKPPKIAGKYANKTKVGWRYNIRRSSASHSEVPYTVYTSPYQTAMASNTSPATLTNGFAKGTYTLPSGPGDNDYYVTVDMQWWKNGSSGVEGYINISYDFYKLVRGSTSHVFHNACPQDF